MELNGKKELQRQVLAYSKTRPVRDGLKHIDEVLDGIRAIAPDIAILEI